MSNRLSGGRGFLQERFGGTKGVLIALTAQVFLNMLGLGIVGPVMPLYAKSFGVSAAMVGMLGTAFALARMTVNMPVGALADRIGRRPLLIAGPFITAVGSLGSALAPNFAILMAFRLVQGVGSAALVTTAMTVLADITTRETRGRYMSLYQGAMLLGQSFGPTVGGLVGEHFGFRAPFFTYALLSFLAGLWAVAIMPETRAMSQAQAATGAPASVAASSSSMDCARMLLRDRSFVLISLIMFMAFFTRVGTQSNVLPMFASYGLGMSTSQIGVALTVIAVANLITLNWSGKWADRYGRKAVIVPASVMSGVSLAVFALSRNYMGFLGSAVLFGMSTGLAGPAPAAYTADLAPAGRTAFTMGLSRTISDVGMATGPVLLGWIVDTQGYGAALRTNAVIYVAVALAFGLLARETVVRRAAQPARSPAP
jgi:multidrug resistance protein